MGLDMFLCKINVADIGRKEPYDYGDPELNEKYRDERWDVPGEEIGYWRKANAIHGWFVNKIAGGVDECQRIYVEAEQLAGLLTTAKEAMGRLKARDVSWLESNLPPMEGFFFGTYQYDEGYEEDLRNTVVILEKALTPGAFDPATERFYYQASW